MGVAQYAEDVQDWRLVLPPSDINGEVRVPKGWKIDGVICRLTSDSLKQELLSLGIPCVNVSWLDRHSKEFTKVVSCVGGCAKLAADYLIGKQFSNIGFVGFHPSLNYSDEFELEIKIRLNDKRVELKVFEFPHDVTEAASVEDGHLENWLAGLEKPIALIAWTSAIGEKIIAACENIGAKVPDDVAILCLEHDRLFSAIAKVPLSNIDQDPWRVGYSAAQVLDKQLRGGQPPSAPVLIPPISVVSRVSTEATAVKDKYLAAAIRYIYLNVSQGITVSNVVKHLGISRRALETRFKSQLNSTPAAYIRKVQLQNVAKLLRSSELTITEVAIRTGFEYPEVMMRSFKRSYGVTPLEFRCGIRAEKI